jgi:23S rRNA pseudouridine1911/1915/1917 synthase
MENKSMKQQKIMEYNGIIDLKGQSSLRLDRYIAEYTETLSRSALKNCAAQIFINDKPAKPSQKAVSGMRIRMIWQQTDHSFEAQDLPLDILYEDDNVWVINKKQGMVVHPGAGHHEGTLANALFYRIKAAAGRVFDTVDSRIGIVHRLDMDTSGVIICAKNTDTHNFLAAQFKNRSVKKRYMAIVDGSVPQPEGLVDNYIDRSRKNRRLFVCGNDEERGRRAVTGYRVLKYSRSKTLVLFKPHTGRTHQLRVHAAAMGFPITGDPLYNRDKSPYALMLHAWKLKIRLPGETDERIFCAKVPERFYVCLKEDKE